MCDNMNGSAFCSDFLRIQIKKLNKYPIVQGGTFDSSAFAGEHKK